MKNKRSPHTVYEVIPLLFANSRIFLTALFFVFMIGFTFLHIVIIAPFKGWTKARKILLTISIVLLTIFLSLVIFISFSSIAF
jgi:hypothetical protein